MNVKIAMRQIARLSPATQLVFAATVALTILSIGLLRAGVQSESLTGDSQLTGNPDWSELGASMDKMHMAMQAVARSGNSDIDFVRLMLPHHQAAIDMAKTELLYGKDPQMRRLAQEIITDQQSEIELMERWLKQREPASAKENRTPVADSGNRDQR
jgi:uncharacterized protein (DUF305 family)